MDEKSPTKILTHVLFILVLITNYPAYGRTYAAMMGSTVLYPMITAAIEAFYDQTNISPPILEAVGSGPALKAFCQGPALQSPDVVFSSRRITENERAQCAKNTVSDILEVPLGLDAVALVSRQQVPGMTLEILSQAFGRDPSTELPLPQRWSQIGATLPDAPILLIGPPLSAGTFDVFEHHILKSTHRELRQDGVYVAVLGQENLILQKLSLSPAAFGLISLSSFHHHEKSFYLLPINGVIPSKVHIQQGRYPLVRTLYMYINRARLKRLPALAAFLSFLVSEASLGDQGLLQDHGLIPLAPTQRAQLRKQVQAMLQRETAL